MDSINNYQEIIEKVLNEYANFLGNDDRLQRELVFDRTRDRYLLVETRWENTPRIYGILLS